MAEISEFVGKTLVAVEVKDSEAIVFTFTDGSVYEMYHSQDCCESVYIHEIVGDLAGMVGYEIVFAEKVTNEDDPPDGDSEENYQWTFYKLTTNRDHATISWFGSSNGYYSVEVDIIRVVVDE